jgi:Holliday junction resolvasome RuvABC endonuclease subunit
MFGPLDGLVLPGPAFGVDPSTKRCAVGIITTDLSVRYAVKEIAQPRSPAARISVAIEDLTLFFGQLVAEYGRPAYVLVEQPFAGGGKSKVRVHPQSYYLLAATLAAVHRATGGLTAIGTEGPTGWKLDAMGQGLGNASKPRILAWTRDALGYEGVCASCHAEGSVCEKQGVAHDEADAQAIAVAAARRLSGAV